MSINNKSDIKIYSTELLPPKGNKTEAEHKKIDSDKGKKEDKNSDININVYNNIRIQISTIDYQQRNIQEKISLIQAEELKINQIENSLRKAKEIYMESIKNKSKEESKYKNIIKDFVNQASNIEQWLEGKNYKLNKENEYNQTKQEYVYLNNEYKGIDDINNALREIANIKTKLTESKDKLVSLAQMIENVKVKIKNEENYIEDYIEVIKYTKEAVLINPSEHMKFQNNIINDMVLKIFK